MQVRRTFRVSLLAGATTLGVALGVLPAHAEPIADHALPFPCGQAWTGSTRDAHSPSKLAVDFNRADDVDDPVVSSAPGTILTADSIDNSGYGRWVVIDHGNNERSLYAHLNRVMVSVGQKVDQGQQIGTVGSSGNSSGPHLHFEEKTGSTVVWPWFSGVKFVFGSTVVSRNCVDVPLAANWMGDRAAEPTVFRRTAPRAQFRIRRADGQIEVKKFGRPTDEPVAGDWDGNGFANPGIYRPSVQRFRLKVPGGPLVIPFGAATDKPLAGDWDGDGRTDVGTWTPSRAEFALRSRTGTVTRIRLGDANDLPVTGDWDGDGRTDVGVFDQATASWTLRKVDVDGTVWTAGVQFGATGDLPVTGDWDANGRTDLGTWALATAAFKQRRAPSATTSMRTVTTIRHGAPR